MIRILKASAGSGKTFQLAKTYIRQMLRSDDRNAYRHILAVTFTNKATAEMKNRILKELDILSRNPAGSDYFAEFSREFGDEDALRRRCADLLTRILHDYSAFSVSTIDKFFQMTLKAFAREIGQFASYQVELDRESLLQESVDRILDGLSEDRPQLLHWLTDSVMDQLRSGGKLSLERGLVSIAGQLKSDAHRDAVRASGLDESLIYSQPYLEQVRSACRTYRKEFAGKVADAAARVLDVLASAGVKPEDSNRGFLSALWGFKTPNDPIAPPTEAFLRKAADPDQWFAKAKAPALMPKVRGVLDPVLEDFTALFGDPYRAYATAGLLLGQLYGLRIASELYREFDALLKEKNVMSIDDSNHILERIIAGSDAPFVYEKLGVRFEDFLLDEFQDTSSVQWRNFRPLLSESQAGGHESLIVGDVKQSIYRWRGSDWALLASGVGEDFPEARADEPLRENWRSLRNIVRFNGRFFRHAAAVLDAQYGAGARIGSLYADVEQEVRAREEEPGLVRCTFTGEDQLPLILSSVRSILSSGGAYGQIAILVRGNETGSAIASYLIAQGVPVISDDSLRVKSAVTVRRLVSLLTYVENPQDAVGSYLAASLGVTPPAGYHSVVDLCESLLRTLSDRFPDTVAGEVLYIQSFMDNLQEWMATGGNNLPAFLRFWADADPKIASPEGTDSVRIMTVHKSKGLEFPYVIFPFAESVGLFRGEWHWSRPALDHTPLAGKADGIYPVLLSEKSLGTCFAGDYTREKLLQYVDNINIFYVAMTRAGRYLHVIADRPSRTAVPFKDMSQILHAFLEEVRDPEKAREAALTVSLEEEDGAEVFSVGRMPSPPARKAAAAEPRDAAYPSYPLNPDPGEADVDVRERGRLKFSADAVDFFSAEGETGAEASIRLKGILLHGILASVVREEDLPDAVRWAALSGALDPEQVPLYRDYLAGKLASVRERGWFAAEPSAVRNEAAVIGTDGLLWRPDRVVESPEGLCVVDYKFGHEARPAYARQVARYCELYRRMGYGPVRGFLWYVEEDRIEEVS